MVVRLDLSFFVLYVMVAFEGVSVFYENVLGENPGRNKYQRQRHALRQKLSALELHKS